MANGINPRDGHEEKKNLLNIINDGHVAKQKPHVLMMPYPGQGHVNPLMDLAKKLASHGVTITFVNSQFIHDRLVETQEVVGKIALGHDVMPRKGEGDDDDGSHEDVVDLELCVLGGGHGDDDAPIRMMGIPDGVAPHDHIFHDVAKHCEALLHHMPSHLLHAVTCLLQPPVTCIVADIYALLCTQPVATRLSVPHVGFWTQNAASYLTRMLAVQDHNKYKEFMVANGESDESYPTIPCFPGAPPIKPSEIYTFLQPSDPSDFVFSHLIQSFAIANQCTHILMNTYHTLEAESLEFIQTRQNMLAIGPLLPSLYLDTFKTGSTNIDKLCNHEIKLEASSMWVENDSCLAWLDAQDPDSVLYVSLGSIAIISDQQMAIFKVALEALHEYPILMVDRENSIFVVDDGFTTMSNGNIMVIKWAPQLKVLNHPAVGGFLTHCGWNSTLEAICKGVPMLCWPFFADQMLNCRCIVDSWKIGLEFQKDKAFGLVNREEIEAKVKYLMNPSSTKVIREQAHKLSLMAMESYHGLSKHSLDTFINFLLQ